MSELEIKRKLGKKSFELGWRKNRSGIQATKINPHCIGVEDTG
jgi:hypothetical protein